MNYLEIAKIMLGVDELPEDLEIRLNKINDLVRKVIYYNLENPGLHSRQIIATIIEQWQRNSLED